MRYLKCIPLLALFVLLCACGTEEAQFTATQYSAAENQSSYRLENELLCLTMDGATSYFRLEDKRTGEVWTSVPDGAAEESADENTRCLLRSTLVLTYMDRYGASTTYDAYRYAIEDGSFRIVQEDERLRVDYMIGHSERAYILPEVISEERMDALLAQMEPVHEGNVRKSYRRLDPARLGEEQYRTLSALLPALKERTVLYAISSAINSDATSTLQDYQLAQLEEAFLSVGYDAETAQADRVQADSAEGGAPQYNVSVYYRLDGDALVVEVPTAEIGYPADYPLTQLQVLPYLCAASQTDEGWLFVPDGGGGQIFFNNGKTAQTAYYANVYGWDETFARERRVQETDAAFPVFGIARNNSYLLAVAEGGDAELAIEADVSGKGSAYNYVKPIFNVVHGEETSISAKSNVTVRVFQQEAPDETLVLRYFSGGSASYVDMALRYRAYLEESCAQFAPQEEAGLPLVLEFIGALDKGDKVLGMPIRKTIAAADYQEVLQIVQSLPEVENLRVKYSAVLNGGLNQTALMEANVVSALGSEKERQALIEALRKRGATLCVGGYALMVLDTAASDGFSTGKDAIRDTSNLVVTRYPFDQATQFEMEKKEEQVHLLNSAAAARAVQTLSDFAAQWGAGVAFSDVGDLLYSDFNHKGTVSRDAFARAQSEMLAALAENETQLLLSGGNAYAAVYADCITEMELRGGAYDIIDRSIPFYQIALHGYVTYTAKPLNAAEDYRKALLTAVEYGAGLSFRFFETDYAELRNSRYTYNGSYFSANYADWQTELQTLYARLNAELGHTYALTISDHAWLTDKVALTQYADGTRVYVNYGTQDYTDGARTVPAQDWLVEKGEGNHA